MEPAAATSTNDSARPDGRNSRKLVSRDAILASCRHFMLGGNFRPSMATCCRAASRSQRTGFQLFGDVETLRLEVLKMPGVAETIGIVVISRPPDAIARAVVLGRV